MAVNQGFLDLVLEQLKDLEEVSSRKMFGGAGIYIDGKIIGIVHEATLYFKVNQKNVEDYTEMGMKQFNPYKDKPMKMPYYEVPPEVIEDGENIQKWANASFEAIYG